ncbi:MAG: glycosyltransferase family 4 protein, partial [Candidatus Eisenbacteria bacterium]|nr:glycosyltransferase family 4 protein [Candidatus Eisenbacteria bacterium]
MSAAARRKFLIIYAQPTFWSMGEGIGAGSFSRTPSALASRGHDVHIVLPAPPGQPSSLETKDGVHLHRFATGTRFSTPYAPLPIRLVERVYAWSAFQRIGTWEAMRIARELRPDIVLSYGTFEAPVARRVAQRLGVPNVVRLFGSALSMNLDDPIRFRLNFPEIRAFRTPCARLILTNDGADGERVARRLGVPCDRFIHLRNGLDFTHFVPGPEDPAVRERLGVPPGAPILLTATRLHQEKKLERVIDAVPELARRLPDAVAVLVGEGPERARLEAHVRRLGIERSVRMPGAVPNRDLVGWYRTAAIVLSLLDRTNASNPVFEAMACERCVVALDAGTTREVVVPEETGVLIERSDLPRLGNVLADLLADPGRRERLGKAARRHVRSIL